MVAVTGGAGFLGGHLVRRLREGGAEVRVVDNAPAPAWVAGLGAGYAPCDVSDPAQVRGALEGAEVVVHAAFAPPGTGTARMTEVNVAGTDHVLAAAASGAARVVVISSTVVDQPPRWGPFPRSGLARLDAYRRTRAGAEAVADRYRRGGLQVAVVRPKTFVGPERVGAFALVFELVRRGSPVLLPGAGRNRYQLLDIRDFAAGVELLTRSGGVGLYCFGATEFGTVADDIAALVDHAGTASLVRRLPAPLAGWGVRAVELAGLPPLSEWYHCAAAGRDSTVDVSRAVDELGWRPERSNIASLLDAFDWFADRRSGGGSAPSTHPVPLAHRVLSGAVRAVLR